MYTATWFPGSLPSRPIGSISRSGGGGWGRERVPENNVGYVHIRENTRKCNGETAKSLASPQLGHTWTLPQTLSMNSVDLA